jgi:hypothetical protein
MKGGAAPLAQPRCYSGKNGTKFAKIFELIDNLLVSGKSGTKFAKNFWLVVNCYPKVGFCRCACVGKA